DAELWVAEALLDDSWSPASPGDLRAREAVLATVRDHFPYVDQHALVIDSPHDGGPILSRIGVPEGAVWRALDELTAVPRTAVRATGGTIHEEPGEPQLRR